MRGKQVVTIDPRDLEVAQKRDAEMSRRQATVAKADQ